MAKVGNTGVKLARGRGDIMPRDFAAAVKDIKLRSLPIFDSPPIYTPSDPPILTPIGMALATASPV